MRSLIISGYGIKLSYSKGVLVVRGKDGKSSKYSLAEVDRVVIMTSGVSITSRALRALTSSGIELVVLDSKGLPVAVLHHPYVTRTVEARRGQYLAYIDGRGIEVVKAAAISKILNQAGMLKRVARTYGLKYLREDVEVIKGYARAVARVEGSNLLEVRKEVMHLEALAAKTYWGAYASLLPEELGFRGRDQGGEDAVNKALNYGYGILYPECWRAVALAGLDPYAGFLHSDRSGKPVLVFDVIEAFRSAAVDYPLLKAFRRGWAPRIEGGLLSHESRVEIVKLVSEGLRSRFRVGDKVKELRTWINTFANALANYLRGGPVIKPLVFRW